jgi:hypothetical protein
MARRLAPGGPRLIRLASLLVLLCASAVAAERLGAAILSIRRKVSAAGISSGAFTANQLHIAHSADIMGAATIAGGAYGCARLDASSDGVKAPASQPEQFFRR